MLSRRNVLSLLLVLAIFGLIRYGVPALGMRALGASAQQFTDTVAPLVFEDTNNQRPPAARNAAFWAKAGATALPFDPDRLELVRRLAETPLPDWSEADTNALRAFLGESPLVLDLFHEATQHAESSFELDYKLDPASIQIPNLLAFIRAGRLLVAEALLRHGDGDTAGAIQSIETLRTSARACLRERPLIFRYVGLALERMTLRGLARLIDSGWQDPETLRALAEPLLPEGDLALAADSIAAEGSMIYNSAVDPRLREEMLANVGSFAGRQSLRLFYARDAARSLDGYADVYQAFVRQMKREEPPGAIEHVETGYPLQAVMQDAVERFQINASVRGLAQLALDVWRDAVSNGGYPTDLARYPAATWNPYDGAAATYGRTADGGVEIALPSATAKWESNRPDTAVPRPSPGFRWQLPPIAAPEPVAP